MKTKRLFYLILTACLCFATKSLHHADGQEAKVAEVVQAKSTQPLRATAPATSHTSESLIRQGTDASLQAWSDALHHHPEETVRQRMAAELDALSLDGALEPVTSILSWSQDEIVIAAVCRTINRMAKADTVAFLTELAHEADRPQQRARALEVLADIENPAAVSGLARALVAEPDEEVRLAAGKSLAKIHNLESAQALIAAFEALPPVQLIERSALLHHLGQMPREVRNLALRDKKAPALRALTEG
jgi:HEAT repeat protein